MHDARRAEGNGRGKWRRLMHWKRGEGNKCRYEGGRMTV